MSEQPDMIAQVGKLMDRFSDAEDLVRRDATYDRDATILLASSVLAVAAELREVRNVLHEINMRLAARSE